MARKPVTRRKPLRGSSANLPDWSGYRKPNLPPCSNSFVGSTAPKSMFSELHAESDEVREEIMRKATQVAPICNKGAYMFIGKSDDITSLGRKK